MTLKEYESQLAIFKKEFEDKRKELATAYAMSNNPYKVGDILQSRSEIIKVESVHWGYNNQCLPECYYRGTQLTKKLEPKKRHDRTALIVLSGVKRKLN